jgi:peroxiredoxin
MHARHSCLFSGHDYRTNGNCPKEHQQHLDLAKFRPKVGVAYTRIVTIATDEHHTLQEFRDSVGAQWTFLADPGRIVQKDLDIQEYTDPEHDPMVPVRPSRSPKRFVGRANRARRWDAISR